MMRFRRPGPLWQMTLALVTMTISILLLADLLLGGSSEREHAAMKARKQLSESLAVQATVLLRDQDPSTLDGFLREVLLRVPELRSVGVRQGDGALVAAAGPHVIAWQQSDQAQSTIDNVRVPLSADGKPWGAVELSYRVDDTPWWRQWLQLPHVQRILFVAVVGAFGFALYMRRALQHLDPSAVIPERVQRAFDVMAEGVVVLDPRGRVMLANRAFREMTGDDDVVRIGRPLSEMAWLAGALPADLAVHPWNRAMSARQNTVDDQLRIRKADGSRGTPPRAGDERRMLVNCAPINDQGGAVRGCMATFTDMTALHRANLALRKAMEEVKVGEEALQRKNLELQRLATQDVLSGCLNRRAFMESAEQALAAALRERSPLGCLMLDIDHFKAVNDTHGHGVGDRVIAEVAREMREAVEPHHIVGRYGGEEFCVMAPGLDQAALLALGERIRQRVHACAGIRLAEVPGMRVTISVGASLLDGGVDSLATLIDHADQALYRAKRGGRNRVAEFTSAHREGTEAAV